MHKSYLLKAIFFALLFSLSISNAQISFVDKASALGVGVSYGQGEFGGGISFFDYNKDGWDDLTISSESGKPIKFYKNNNGTFIVDNINMPTNNSETKQVQWVDFDNDGDFDFFVSSSDTTNKLYENDGSFNFTDITVSAGLNLTATNSWGASWGDYNNDGFLDVFMCFRKFGDTQPNALFKNNGDGTFTNVSVSAGINQVNDPTFCAAFFDYNNDGWQDIFVTNHKFSQSYLYKNNGNGTFTDVSVISGAGVITDGMSTTIGDYNNDGWFDIYITNLGNISTNVNVLLKNNGDGTFTDTAIATGTTFDSVGWGAVFLDADNDADLDLYVSGMLDGSTTLPSAFYENQGNNTFTIPSVSGFANDVVASFSNAIGDIDNNGFPEIFVVNQVVNNFLWENTTSNSNNWLKVNLEGTSSNKEGIGAVIELTVNSKKQYRYVLNGEGYIAQNSGSEFFGIGTATNINTLKVTWLSGTVDLFTNVTPNQILNIVEGQPLAVADFKILDVQLYPNPVKDKLKIELKNNWNTNAKLTIYNLLGRAILSKEFSTKSTEIDLSHLASGIYLLKLKLGDKTVVKKVIVN
jgi:type IX secretion system substrate protein/ASPIC/UnbV protein/VCBS repeat protein